MGMLPKMSISKRLFFFDRDEYITEFRHIVVVVLIVDLDRKILRIFPGRMSLLAAKASRRYCLSMNDMALSPGYCSYLLSSRPALIHKK